MTYDLDTHQLLFVATYPASFFKTPYATIAEPLETPSYWKIFLIFSGS